MANPLSPEEEEATRSFLTAVGAEVPLATAVKFLAARKWDVERAHALWRQHECTRRREGLERLQPHQEPLASELATGKFTVLESREQSGAAIALFTARKHFPAESTHQLTLQGLVYQLDAALAEPETQRAGLIFIYDMTDSKYTNFDYELSQKILALLKGGYPARLKKVLIVTAPLWFKAPFRFLRLFVREKLRERVHTVSAPQLSAHVARAALPPQLGGRARHEHAAWLRRAHALHAMTHETEAAVVRDAPAAAWSDADRSSGFSDDDAPAPDDAGITPAQLLARCRSLGRHGLEREYEEVRARPPAGTFTHARLAANLAKNRYTDVLCYDHTRVPLSIAPADDPTDDYINANYVDGYRQKNAYICTQGPLPRTTADFWRMVWEQHALVIVMTTRVSERGRVKCAQYWSPTVGGSVTHGDLRISTDAIDTRDHHVVSSLTITHLVAQESRRVQHWQYVRWPDYGVPDDDDGGGGEEVLRFLAGVRSAQADAVADLGDAWAGHPLGPPIVVHCSAGIGRTGTFLTLDTCVSRLRAEGVCDVRATVERIREQRAHSIQMPQQYVFCHAALLQYAAQSGLVDAAQVDDVLLRLQQDTDSDDDEQ